MTEVKKFDIDAYPNIDNIPDNDQTSIFLAILNQDIAKLKKIIESGVDVNLRDNWGNTPLMWAISLYNVDLKIFEELIVAGADFDAKNIYGETVFTKCTYSHNTEAAKMIIRAYADLNGIDINYKTNDTVLSEIAEKQIHPDNEEDRYVRKVATLLDQTPLLKAIYNDNLTEVKELIASGVDVNLVSKLGDNPLRFSSPYVVLENVKELIAAGFDVQGMGLGYTPVMLAVSRNNVDIIRELIKNGADVNNTDKYGMSPLQGAAYKGYLEVLKELIEAGADINYSIGGGAAILQATAGNHIDTVRELIKAGANVNASDEYGITSLMKASLYNIEIVKELIKAGADINAIDQVYGDTPIIFAFKICNIEIVEELTKAGANATAIDELSLSLIMKSEEYCDDYEISQFKEISSYNNRVAKFENNFNEDNFQNVEVGELNTTELLHQDQLNQDLDA